MGFERPQQVRSRIAPSAAAFAVVFGILSTSLFAQDEAPEPAKKDRVVELLGKLKAKGIITQDEYDELAGNTPAARVEARAERRKQAVRDAVDAQKAEAAQERYNGRWNNGITFAAPDNRNTFAIGGRIHADYRYFDENTAPSTFDVRRAYLTLSGKWNEWLTWDLTGDFARTGIALDVAWANAAWSDALQVRAGQFKMPFSLEELGSSRYLDFQERSIVNRLVPGRERGIMLHGAPFLGTTYAVALSNGAGRNNNEAAPGADAPDVIARATVNFAEILGQQAKAVYHLGVAGSVGTLPSGGPALGNTATEARGYAFFVPTVFTGSNTDRQRTAVEAAVAYGPLKLQSEWVRANFKGTSANRVGYDKGIDSYYVRLMWLITGERYAETYRNGIFGQRIVPIQNYTPGGSAWGAWELGLQFSSFDASDIPLTGGTALAAGDSLTGTGTLQSVATGGTLANRATAMTLGLKWIWTPNFKLYLNYIDTKFDNPIRFTPTGAAAAFTSDRERAITMRAAFDF